jgi:hypothetical protein
VLPLRNSKAMNLHLAEIAKDVAPGRHAILLLDQANLGTNSQTTLGASCPSERENGLTGFDQWELV